MDGDKDLHALHELYHKFLFLFVLYTQIDKEQR